MRWLCFQKPADTREGGPTDESADLSQEPAVAATPDAGPQDALEVVSRSITPLRGCPTSPGGGTVCLPSIRPSVRLLCLRRGPGHPPHFLSLLHSLVLPHVFPLGQSGAAGGGPGGGAAPASLPRERGNSARNALSSTGQGMAGHAGQGAPAAECGRGRCGAGEEHPPPP